MRFSAWVAMYFISVILALEVKEMFGKNAAWITIFAANLMMIAMNELCTVLKERK